jgi:pimeloyl-ACP methyl ester carboxylesterase
MADRAHLLTPDVTLGTRIADIVGLIEAEELTGVTLCAHSAGGTVATGVADRIPERIRRLIYLDAVVPESGQSQLDVCEGPEGIPEFFRKVAADDGGGWRIPVLAASNWPVSFADTLMGRFQDDEAWMTYRIDHVGHDMMIAAPDDVVAIVHGAARTPSDDSQESACPS